MVDFHVSTNMSTEILDTRLHTLFTIFLYQFRLESAMLTRLVILDAADAERLVRPNERTVEKSWSIKTN